MERKGSREDPVPQGGDVGYRYLEGNDRRSDMERGRGLSRGPAEELVFTQNTVEGHRRPGGNVGNREVFLRTSLTLATVSRRYQKAGRVEARRQVRLLQTPGRAGVAPGRRALCLHAPLRTEPGHSQIQVVEDLAPAPLRVIAFGDGGVWTGG